MHTELGIGKTKIVYLNADCNKDIEDLFKRFIQIYSMLLKAENPTITKVFRNSKIVITSDCTACLRSDICIRYSKRDLGIYVGDHAYQRKIAEELHKATRIKVLQDNQVTDITIGTNHIGGCFEAYLILKEAMLLLPGKISG